MLSKGYKCPAGYYMALQGYIFYQGLEKWGEKTKIIERCGLSHCMSKFCHVYIIQF